MFIWLSFLCCLANAATHEYEVVMPSVVSIPVCQGLELQAQVVCRGEIAQLFPESFYKSGVISVGVFDATCEEEGTPTAKRRCMRDEYSPETIVIDALSTSSHEASIEDDQDVELGEDTPLTVDIEQASRRQKEILRYLCDHKDSFVPEKDLQRLHNQDKAEVLEDVMELIAEQHNIIYEDGQYRCSSDAHCQVKVPNVYALLLNVVKMPGFMDLVAAEQSYYIYKNHNTYVPVSTVAMWTEMYKVRRKRGASSDRFYRLLPCKNTILKTGRLLKSYECDDENNGLLHSEDLCLVRKSMRLYAQGRELLKNDPLRKPRARVDAALRNHQVLECLQDHFGELVSEQILKDSMVNSDTDHRHREVCRTIASLRMKKHNIICLADSRPRLRSDGALQWMAELTTGEWAINKDCYKKALWFMLDHPHMQKLCATDAFLVLSNLHYAPCHTVVEDIIRLKKLTSDEKECRQCDAQLKRMLAVVRKDGEVSTSPAYYAETLSERVPPQQLRTLERLLSHYKKIHDGKLPGQ